MNDISIRVENLAKKYDIGKAKCRHDRLRDQVAHSLKSVFRRNGRPHREESTFWALKDVSLEIRRGEIVGIVGQNGAGKSTLLKILSQITEPTRGRVEIYGRVGSLLEVGTGFHPELTGRENLYLSGAIIGMKKEEIRRHFDAIVEFAEVGKFLDVPVKRYSSGMFVRLAFAVAAHLDPDILLVDEVLSVGDAAFQKKCLGRIGNAAKGGRTVVFISHNMIAVNSLCERVIWMQGGEIVEDGPSAEVVSKYLAKSGEGTNVSEEVWDEVATAPGNDSVRLHRVCVRPVDGSPSDPITICTPFVIEADYWNLRAGAHSSLSLLLLNEQGITVLNTFPVIEPVWFKKPHPEGLFRSRVYFPGNLLNDGMHRILLLVVRDQAEEIYSHEDVLVFNVQDSPERRSDWHGKWVGAVRPDLRWETELLEGSDALDKKGVILRGEP
jgi:lipopolysaccharide transport system ATP-binding protein